MMSFFFAIIYDDSNTNKVFTKFTHAKTYSYLGTRLLEMGQAQTHPLVVRIPISHE